MEKERDLAANHVKSHGFKREISADNNVADTRKPFKS